MWMCERVVFVVFILWGIGHDGPIKRLNFILHLHWERFSISSTFAAPTFFFSEFPQYFRHNDTIVLCKWYELIRDRRTYTRACVCDQAVPAKWLRRRAEKQPKTIPFTGKSVLVVCVSTNQPRIKATQIVCYNAQTVITHRISERKKRAPWKQKGKIHNINSTLAPHTHTHMRNR